MEPDSTSTAFTPDLLDHLRTWEGKSESLHETLGGTTTRGLAATLGFDRTTAADGTALLPLWHWLFFQPQAMAQNIDVDGHPRLGGFLPPVPLPRRMWAGGRLRWHLPLSVGEVARCDTTIASIKHKGGRSGDLVFVTLKSSIYGQHGLAISEEKDLVYRKAASPGEFIPPAPEAPANPVWSQDIVPNPVLLFRYSALTFNGHRIHYDRPFATSVEGYPGLVVQGPLIATLLACLSLRENPGARFTSFNFKALSPLFDHQPFRLCGIPSVDGKSAQLWAQNNEGRLAMQAEVHYE